jgi:hypothetical protein
MPLIETTLGWIDASQPIPAASGTKDDDEKPLVLGSNKLEGTRPARLCGVPRQVRFGPPRRVSNVMKPYLESLT